MASQYEADIIEKGIVLSWSTWGKMRGETLTLGDISYLRSDTAGGFERIFSVRLDGEDANSRVQQMIASVRAGNLPDSILITQNTKPDGFVIDTSGLCMKMCLDDYVSRFPRGSRIEVSRVCDAEQLRTWLDLVTEALFGRGLVTQEQVNDLFGLESTRFYLGLLEGEAVTACMTITQGDTSVLEMVATLENSRRKGTAAAAIARALTDLRSNGVKTISPRAENGGINVYRRRGFRDCFVRTVASYDWERAQAAGRQLGSILAIAFEGR